MISYEEALGGAQTAGQSAQIKPLTTPVKTSAAPKLPAPTAKAPVKNQGLLGGLGTTIGNFIGNGVKSVADFVGNQPLLSLPGIGTSFNPAPKLTVKSVAKTLPSIVQEPAKFGVGLALSARNAVTGENNSFYQPDTPFAKALLGSQPVKSFQGQAADTSKTLQTVGLPKNISDKAAGPAVIGLGLMNFVGAEDKKAAEEAVNIAKQANSVSHFTDLLAKAAPDVQKAVTGIIENVKNPINSVDEFFHEANSVAKPAETVVNKTSSVVNKVVNKAAPVVNDVKPESNLIDRVTQAIKDAAPVREEQQKLYSQELSKRTQAVIAAGQNLTGDAAHAAQLKALEGPLPTAEYSPVKDLFTPDEVGALKDTIETHPALSPLEKVSTKNGLDKLLNGSVPQESQLNDLRTVFGNGLVDTVLDKGLSTTQKIVRGAAEIANVPRALMSSFDFSAPMRQGIFLAPSHPKEFADAFAKQFKYFTSEDAFIKSGQEIMSRDTYPLMKQGKLALVTPTAALNQREEAFMSNLAEKIPGIGKIVKASDRAYSGFLNKFRADVFDSIVKSSAALGKQDDPQFIKRVADFVNAGTGRGNLPGILNGAAPLLNAGFFSPRLISSRLTLMNPVTYIKTDPVVRKEALKSLLAFAGTGLGVLSLANIMWPGSVSSDLTSADGGKVKIGNTRTDIWGGFLPYIRAFVQLQQGKITSSTTGNVTLLGQGYKPKTGLDVVSSLFTNKEAPLASFITDLLRGTDTIGNKNNFTTLNPYDNTILKRFVPMISQDMNDVLKDQQAGGQISPLNVLDPFGVATQTYGNTPKTSSRGKSSNRGIGTKIRPSLR